jgi:AcrR family transcriptional regulator
MALTKKKTIRRPSSPPPRNRKARGSGHERYAEILAAAKDLFAEYGYEKVSTRKIAERVGISQTALFSYYKTREEIVVRLIHEALTELSSAMVEVDRTANETEDWLRRSAETFVSYGLNHPSEYKLAFMTVKFYGPPYNRIERPPSTDTERNNFDFFELFSKRIACGIEQGVIRADLGTSEAVTKAFFGALHGGISLLVAHPYVPWENPREIVRIQTDIVVTGLLKRSTVPMIDKMLTPKNSSDRAAKTDTAPEDSSRQGQE